MRKCMKAFCILLALCMFLGSMSFAEGEMRIYSDETINAGVGEEFVLPVYIENNSGIASFDISIKYDKEIVEPVEDSEEKGTVAPMVMANPRYMSKAVLLVSGAHHDNFSGDGVLFTYKFRIKDTTATETTFEILSAAVGTLAEDFRVVSSQLITSDIIEVKANEIKVVIGEGIEDITPPDVATTPVPTVVPTATPGVLPDRGDTGSSGSSTGGGASTSLTPVATPSPTPASAVPGASFKADAKDIKYIAPLSGNEFGADELTTRYQVAEALYELLDFENIEEGVNKFSDVDEKHLGMVNALAQTPIIDGYPDGTFGGELNITRAEFVKVVSLAAGIEPDTEIEIDLTDVEGHWGEGYIKAFVDAGYIYGYLDKTFMPDWNIKRCEAVAIINRVIGKKAATVDGSKYTDIIGHWAFGEIEAAVK